MHSLMSTEQVTAARDLTSESGAIVDNGQGREPRQCRQVVSELGDSIAGSLLHSITLSLRLINADLITLHLSSVMTGVLLKLLIHLAATGGKYDLISSVQVQCFPQELLTVNEVGSEKVATPGESRGAEVGLLLGSRVWLCYTNEAVAGRIVRLNPLGLAAYCLLGSPQRDSRRRARSCRKLWLRSLPRSLPSPLPPTSQPRTTDFDQPGPRVATTPEDRSTALIRAPSSTSPTSPHRLAGGSGCSAQVRRTCQARRRGSRRADALLSARRRLAYLRPRGNEMEDSQLPSYAPLFVNTTGAEIIDPETGSDDPEVYLPNHEELISHVALDVSRSARALAPPADNCRADWWHARQGRLLHPCPSEIVLVVRADSARSVPTRLAREAERHPWPKVAVPARPGAPRGLVCCVHLRRLVGLPAVPEALGPPLVDVQHPVGWPAQLCQV